MSISVLPRNTASTSAAIPRKQLSLTMVTKVSILAKSFVGRGISRDERNDSRRDTCSRNPTRKRARDTRPWVWSHVKHRSVRTFGRHLGLLVHGEWRARHTDMPSIMLPQNLSLLGLDRDRVKPELPSSRLTNGVADSAIMVRNEHLGYRSFFRTLGYGDRGNASPQRCQVGGSFRVTSGLGATSG